MLTAFLRFLFTLLAAVLILWLNSVLPAVLQMPADLGLFGAVVLLALVWYTVEFVMALITYRRKPKG